MKNILQSNDSSSHLNLCNYYQNKSELVECLPKNLEYFFWQFLYSVPNCHFVVENRQVRQLLYIS